MENLLKNKLVWMAGLLVMFNVLFFVGSKVIVEKAADAVINKLEKEYSPSPYGPGFDPDKVTPETVRRRALLQDYIDSKNGEQALYLEGDHSNPTFAKMKAADEWRAGWEQERGFNP